MTREITLSKGMVALVDDCDYEELSKYKWCARKAGGTWYAETHGPQKDGKRKFYSMHRVIVNPPDGMQVDHIDRNGLNNMRGNLRLATRAQNGYNCIRFVASRASAYKGVSRHRHKWQASIHVDKRCIGLGTFQTEVEAAIAYNQAARELHGEFAYLNDVEESQ